MVRRRLLLALWWLVATARLAGAGGLLLPTHGVRATERAGALIAGADDADAIARSPAGLARLAAGTRSLTFDAALVYHAVSFTTADGSERDTNQQPGQLVPSLAGALAVTDRIVIGGALYSPYQGIHRYAGDGAQRYESVATAGSRIAVVAAAIAVRVSDRLRVGAVLQNVVSHQTWTVVGRACLAGVACPATDRSFDATLVIEQDDPLAPSALVGVQYDPAPRITVAAAVQAPTRVAADGKMTVALPSSPRFSQATVRGDRVRMGWTLPAALRIGAEWRSPSLRLEAAFAVELWSMHDGIALAPEIELVPSTGPPTPLSPMTIGRDYRPTVASAIGGEWHRGAVAIGAGYSYETAAAPAGDVSVLAPDAAKHLFGIGGGYDRDGWRIGGALGYVAVATVSRPVSEARELSLFGPPMLTTNGGRYASRYLLAGLRLGRQF